MQTAADSVVISELIEPKCLLNAVDMYRDVFALRPDDPAPSPRLLAALSRNGGIALGAHIGGELVGFSYGFTGLTPDGATGQAALYHYMELLVVRARRRNTGIGRTLMHHLRDIVTARGMRAIRWAFDPLRADNAHFYLDVLGARGCDFIPNLYGIENTGRDRGHPTDRIIACWDRDATAHNWPQPPAGLVIGVPRIDIQAGTATVLLAMPPVSNEHSSLDIAGLRQRIRHSFSTLIATGYQPVSCRRAADGIAVYRFMAHTSVS